MGRPRAYNETAMLERAMEVFWRRGYDGTSIQDLVGRTGVNRGSLYGAYSDKRALFLASIKRYLDLIVADNIRRLGAVEPAGRAIREFFLQLVEAPLERLRRGCLLTNSAVELGMEDPAVAALIRGAFRRVERIICGRLVEAHMAGQLAADLQPQARARLLITVLQGIRVMARVGVDRAAMRDAVNCALAGIAGDTSNRDFRHRTTARRPHQAQRAKARPARLRSFA